MTQGQRKPRKKKRVYAYQTKYDDRLPEKRFATKDSLLSLIASVHNGLGVECDIGWEPKHPTQPTKYPPGSVAKVEVLARRVLRGEQLHHPDDVRVHLSPEALADIYQRSDARHG